MLFCKCLKGCSSCIYVLLQTGVCHWRCLQNEIGTTAFTHRAAGVSSIDWVLLSRCVGVLGGRCLELICHILFRQTLCCWRFRWLPRTPLCGGVRPRPQRVEDAGQHDIFTQQCRSGHAGRNHLRRGWLRRQRIPQHNGGVQPRDGRVERLHQDPVCPL